MSTRPHLAFPLLPLVMVACASTRTPGAQPRDMSVTSHESTAALEEHAARDHEDRYDPDAARRRERCRAGHAGMADADPCWTSVTNPTAEHLKHAEDARQRAAEHRAASQALRDAEARACRGVPVIDRDESPFDRVEDIERVDVLSEPIAGGQLVARRTVGAAVAFRAVPGMTTPWLQRVVDCHLARNTALGHDVPEMAHCPLVPAGVRATVVESRGGFVVEIRADDERSAREVVARAESLRQK